MCRIWTQLERPGPLQGPVALRLVCCLMGCLTASESLTRNALSPKPLSSAVPLVITFGAASLTRSLVISVDDSRPRASSNWPGITRIAHETDLALSLVRPGPPDLQATPATATGSLRAPPTGSRARRGRASYKQLSTRAAPQTSGQAPTTGGSRRPPLGRCRSRPPATGLRPSGCDRPVPSSADWQARRR